jgi:hypothetical protein
MPVRYPDEFRQRAIELTRAGDKPVTRIALWHGITLRRSPDSGKEAAWQKGAWLGWCVGGAVLLVLGATLVAGAARATG